MTSINGHEGGGDRVGIMPLTPLLTEKEAASALGWSVSALQQRRFRGQQPDYLKLGGKSVRYEVDTLKAFIDQGRVSPQGVS